MGRTFRAYRFVDWSTQGFLVVVAVVVGWLHRQAPPGAGWLVAGHGVVMLAIHGLVAREASGRAGRGLRFLREIYPILLYTAFFRETELVNRLLGWPRLDPVLLRWEDRVFGGQPSVRLMDAFPSVWVSELMYASYASYYLMIAGLALLFLVRNPPVFRQFIAVVSFVFYACYLLYMVVPVIGPRLLFRPTPERDWYAWRHPDLPLPAYPETLIHGPFFQLMAFIYRNFEALSAAFPSSHVAIAVTTLWFTWRHLRPWRWVHGTLVILLCVSTVYCRYHYALDVPAGLLAAAVLIPVGSGLFHRWDRPAARDQPDLPQPESAIKSIAAGSGFE